MCPPKQRHEKDAKILPISSLHTQSLAAQKGTSGQTKRFLGVERLGDVYVDEGYKGHGCEDIADVTVVKSDCY
jgi:hypothetical protein